MPESLKQEAASPDAGMNPQLGSNGTRKKRKNRGLRAESQENRVAEENSSMTKAEPWAH